MSRKSGRALPQSKTQAPKHPLTRKILQTHAQLLKLPGLPGCASRVDRGKVDMGESHRALKRFGVAGIKFLCIPFVFCLAALSTGCASSGGSSHALSQEAILYSQRMHDRFHVAWKPPEFVRGASGKVSVPIDVQIDDKGRVVQFKIVQSSGNEEIDRSIRDVGKKITQVAPPPLTGSDRYFDLRIYFELDVQS